MKQYFHSVTLDKEKCKGCTNCIKHCPTEAIRVQNGKAKIIKERCIDCGECIKVCPYRAKKAVTDDFDSMKQFKYTIAMPAPSLYVQFKNKPDINLVLTGLKKLGFDDVFEVARAAELVTMATKKMIEQGDIPRPAISSACPAVIRLIRLRFPDLIENLVPLLAPIELAAYLAKERAMKKTGLRAQDIGMFFITPCAAKVTSTHAPIGVESSLVDGCVAMNEVYKRLVKVMKSGEEVQKLATASLEGIAWAQSSGEGAALKNEKYIAVDGIHNVLKVLEEIEDGHLDGLEFAELSACMGGCIGGPLTVENPFVARTRIPGVLDNTELVHGDIDLDDLTLDAVKWRCGVEFAPVMKLDDDMVEAMRKMEEMERIVKTLPQLDCGSCGAPSCHALAEDIVRGFAKEDACIFKLRERMRELEEEKQGIGNR